MTNARSLLSRNGLVVMLLGVIVSFTSAEEQQSGDEQPDQTDYAEQEARPTLAKKSPDKVATAANAKTQTDKPQTDKSKYPPYAEFLKEAETTPGLIKLHRKDDKLYGEITQKQLNQDFIVLISIAKGIGQGPLLGGMSWGFGDDWVWQFRKVGERIHLVRRNVRFTAAKGSPEASAVALAYTDSVLYSLPLATKTSASYVVDLNPIFMSDLPQIVKVLEGFHFSSSKSTWAAVKSYPDNIELQVAATYASTGGPTFDSVADSRGVTINVHYSISELPPPGSYTPRLADDRVGYFLTVVKDYSKRDKNDRFVRYINRWNLEKSDADAAISPPKKAVVFWLEKTVPFKYRKPIADGIREWNRAFEKAGFYDAIQVRQQPDNPHWDPEDIRYNTFRWITASAGLAMGPSRVNPTTGQILDADIIFDADFLQFWKRTYETFTPEGIELFTGGPLDLESYHRQAQRLSGHDHQGKHACCNFFHGMSHEFAMGAAIIAARQQRTEDLERMINQGLKAVTMHEVGHTLGLRHNFKASSAFSLDKMNQVELTANTGLTSSVMDYTPANLAPSEVPQGDYFSSTIGSYDIWAIQYGYQSISGDTQEEVAELKRIASRSGETELAYATDEDTRGIDPDPTSNRWDLGDDGLAYARSQAKLVQEAWPQVVERMTDDGEGYHTSRRAFGVLLATHGRVMHLASRYIGGLLVSRSHKGDTKAKAPFEVVDADKQREALTLLEEQMLSDDPYQFPPALINQLSASRWRHWGTELPLRTDYPVHSTILMWQERILSQLLSPLTLERLHDSELKLPPDQDAFTTAELIERLTQTVFAETDTLPEGPYTNRKPAISSLRRNLQRSYLKRISQLAMGNTSAPQDCQTVAYAQLIRLADRIDQVLESDVQLDSYSRAHLEESASRIHKVVEARLQLSRP